MRNYDAEPDNITLYLREIGRIPLLSKAEEVELAKRIEAGDKDARERMILANLRLVVEVAKWYQNRGLSLLDLISEGSIGLITAVKRFNWRRGNKFSTCAVWWIKQAIARAVSDKGKAIRLPVYMDVLYAHVRNARSTLECETQRDPTYAEIAAFLGTSESNVRLCVNAAVPPLSLDTRQFNDDDNDMTIGDYLESDYMGPEEIVQEDSLSGDMREALSVLNPRERQVISLRYYEGKSLAAAGMVMGVSRERIRQIENDALRKLRAPGVTKRLREVG